jgi:hypothetical protein
MSLEGKIALDIGAAIAKELTAKDAWVISADIAWSTMGETAPGIEQVDCDIAVDR